MTNSKKFFVSAVALLLALTVGSGAAQAQAAPRCEVNPTTPDLRSEGRTEMLGDIYIMCRKGNDGASAAAAHRYPAQEDAQFTIHVNGATVTNRIHSADNAVAQDITLEMWETDSSTPGPSDLFNLADSNTEGIDSIGTTANAKVISGNAVQFDFDRPAGSAGQGDGGSPENFVSQPLSFRIRGIRVDASESSSATVTVTVRHDSIDFDIPVGISTVTVGNVKSGLKSSITTALESLTCSASVAIGANALRTNPTNHADLGIVKVEENINNGFQINDMLMLTFADVPAGVRVYLRPGDKDGDGDDSNDVGAVAAEGAANDLGGTTDSLNLQLRAGGVDGGAASSVSPDYEFTEVSLSGGAGTAFYKVTGADDTAKEDKLIPVYFRRAAGGETGMATVSVSYAPVSNVGVASPATVRVPRFTQTVNPLTLLTLAECSTTLLFPFVTNQANHDTGIAISNTSMDAFGTDEIDAACTIHYYGNMSGDGAMPDSDTSNMIAAGEHLVFSLSAGNPEMSISAVEGFQGYLMARCGFRFAHGLAFITNNFGIGTPSLAHGYLALVVDVDFDDRSISEGRESLNH